MGFQLSSIKTRLLLGAVFITLNVVMLAAISLYHFRKIHTYHYLENQMHQLQLAVMQLIKNDNDFFQYDLINPNFFEKGSTQILAQRDDFKNATQQSFEKIANNKLVNSSGLGEEFDDLYKLLSEYHLLFSQLQEASRQRGFKDFGLIGEMRIFAHKIQEEGHLSERDILTLRRHEKDFQLRNEKWYVDQFNTLKSLKEKELNRKGDTKGLNLLDSYGELFNRLVDLESKLGLLDNTGMKRSLDRKGYDVHLELVKLKGQMGEFTAKAMRKGNLIFLLSIIFSLLLSLFLSYSMAIRISRPLQKLSKLMDQFRVNGNITATYSLRNESSRGDSEIISLANSFINLSKKVKSQFKEIEKQSQQLERQNQELREVNLQLDRFVYAAAHDLKAPLTSVMGLINITERELGERSNVKGNFQMMRTSIGRLDALIRDMVDFSKNKRGEEQIQILDIEKLCTDVFQYQTQGLEHPPKLDLYQDVESEFYGDLKRLEIILRNLISNAIKYADTDKSESWIKIRIFISSQEAFMEIEDNGIGIGEEHFDKVFNMFYRATEKAKGSGLGLFLVKDTLDMLGGNISISSALGTGTLFQLHLPNKKPQIQVEKNTKKAPEFPQRIWVL